MKTLVIARHAKSDWSFDLPDHDRPLNKRGQSDAPRMGKLLKSYKFQPDIMLSSTALRARTTAELVAKELGFSEPLQLDRGIYDNGPGYIAGLVQEFPDSANLAMVFGHNPTQESLVRHLLDLGGGITMPTGAMVCIEFMASSWKFIRPGQCSLKWMLIPRMIKNYQADEKA